MHEYHRMPRKVTDPETHAPRREKMSRGLQIAIVVFALVIALGILEWLHRGTVALIFSMLETLVLALWGMLCSIANACREFMRYIKSVSS